MTPSSIQSSPGLKPLTADAVLSTEGSPTAVTATSPPPEVDSASPSRFEQTISPDALCIELRRSVRHVKLIVFLASLGLVVCLSSQLPWLYRAFAALWLSVSVFHWQRRPQTLAWLIDDGDRWYAQDLKGLVPLHFKHADYCSSNLLVLSFSVQAGVDCPSDNRPDGNHAGDKQPYNRFSCGWRLWAAASVRTRRIFIWRDSVTPAAFSWLSARITLAEADAPVENMATSGYSDRFSFSSRPEH